MENPMTRWARWLKFRIHKFEVWRRAPKLALGTLIILPASILFCLTMPGCEVQDGSVAGNVTSHSNAPQVIPSKENVVPFSQQEKPKDSDLPRIVAFGDSLTAGLGVPPDDAYPGQLARWLSEKGQAYQVINAGVSGETSAGGLRRVEWILKSQPMLVILELGANDGLRGQPLNETYHNLKSIIERLQAKGVIVVLAGMQLPLNYGDDYTQEFSELFERLAEEHDVSFIPFFLEGVATHRDLNQGDGLHPNAKGYSIVVQNVWKTLRPILKEIANEG